MARAPAILLVLMAGSALLTACAATDRVQGNAGGIALRINDEEEALREAREAAEAHCREFDRYAVLQGVSEIGGDRRLATFNCVRARGGGVAVLIGNRDDDLEDARERAERYCEDFGRIPVLQSVSAIENRRVAAFNCVQT